MGNGEVETGMGGSEMGTWSSARMSGSWGIKGLPKLTPSS